MTTDSTVSLHGDTGEDAMLEYKVYILYGAVSGPDVQAMKELLTRTVGVYYDHVKRLPAYIVGRMNNISVEPLLCDYESGSSSFVKRSLDNYKVCFSTRLPREQRVILVPLYSTGNRITTAVPDPGQRAPRTVGYVTTSYTDVMDHYSWKQLSRKRLAILERDLRRAAMHSILHSQCTGHLE